jgi:hypothetical protein
MLLQDPGLCIFVLRSIRRAFPGKDSICLRTALNEIELEKLADIAEAPEYEIAGVSYKNASRHQTYELQQSVFMSTAASVMAEQASLDTAHAAWAAFVKELGFLLLSWSYPHIFNRAMSRSKANKSTLAAELEKLLGVGPEAVGARLMKRWRLTLDDIEESGDDISIEDIVASAEVWARAQDPIYGGRAREQWQKLAPVVADVFGNDFDETLFARCEKQFEPHKVTLPLAAGVHETGPKESRESVPFDLQREHHSSTVERIQQSRNLNQLPDFVKDVFADILETTESAMEAQEGLRILVNRVFPLLGFTRGCVFTLAKDGGRMFPVLRFGDLPLSNYDERLFDKYQGMKPLIFQSVPFKREGLGFAGEYVTYLCGGLDSSDYQGVLYLERPLLTEENIAEDEVSLLNFRCLREALNSLFATLLSGPSSQFDQ